MDTHDPSENEGVVSGIDILLLELDKNVTRNTFYVSLLVGLHGLTFLFFAWIANEFLITVVAGLVGGIIFLFGFVVSYLNFKTRLRMFAEIESIKKAHPELEADSTVTEYASFNIPEDNDK
jgi:hypothetical protein